MSSDPIEVLRRMVEKLAAHVRPTCDELWEEAHAALASLSAPKRHERPKGNTPIEELLAEYEADGCDHSNMGWVRAAAQRYVETMEDSQVRCLLHVLSAPKPPSMNDNAVAVNESAPVNDKPESAEAVAWVNRWELESSHANNLTAMRNGKCDTDFFNVPLFTAPPRPEASDPPARKDGSAGIDRLWDSQWVNIVNAPEVLNAESAEDAVNIAVRMTEQTMAANFAKTAPQQASAPVGVEGETVAGYIDRLGERIRRGMADVVRFGVHGSHGRYMCDLAAEAIAYAADLAQQPAAVDGASYTRQEVAEAMRVLRGRNGSTALHDEVLDDMERVLAAALEGQQQGGTPE